MTGRVLFALIVLGLAGFVGNAQARQRSIDATPFAHRPCSVLDGEPCTPSTCSVFDHGPCIPEIDYPIGQNLQVTVMSVPPDDQAARYRRPDHDLDTIGDLFAMLRACWSPPPQDAARPGMQMAVMFALKTSGVAIAPPRVTFASRDAAPDMRDRYLAGIKDSLASCFPLKLTKGLGGAIAGRPIMIRYVDNRTIDHPADK
jgi:hypothetical protein